MRLATITRVAKPGPLAAIAVADGFVGIDHVNDKNATTFPLSLLDLVQTGASADLVARADELAPSELADDEADVRVVAPWVRAGKIIGIGLNYADHARTLGAELPVEPATFLRPTTAVSGPGDAIRLPAQSERVTAEAELGLVIGTRCRNVTVDEARACVFGFASIIDVTAEDILRKNPRFLTRAKSFDSFFQWGPVVITANEVPDVDDLRVRTVVNGLVVAENRVANMTFGPYSLVSFLSHEMTLEPGDLISTGTPGAGVIAAGDSVGCEISGFPRLEAPVIADA